ncbi:hypothetical protein FDECE_8299 [Fusarium decemcellulare]|nr:hypothetical protein FDECE_8299 [Fusarium decemcellulare]
MTSLGAMRFFFLVSFFITPLLARGLTNTTAYDLDLGEGLYVFDMDGILEEFIPNGDVTPEAPGVEATATSPVDTSNTLSARDTTFDCFSAHFKPRDRKSAVDNLVAHFHRHPHLKAHHWYRWRVGTAIAYACNHKDTGVKIRANSIPIHQQNLNVQCGPGIAGRTDFDGTP